MPARERPSAARAEHLRRSIASAAARLMAEDGISDYGFAKRKAARQLGCSETHALPTNQEVEEALRAYLEIYQGDEQPAALRHLRETALSAMRLLERFTPYLTGAVLTGTAGRFSHIDIELYPDNAKEVEIYLLGRGASFDHLPTRARTGAAAPEAVLELLWEDETVRLAIYDRNAERNHRRNPHTGQAPDRARIGAVEALLQEVAG